VSWAFRVWAPAADRVDVVVAGTAHEMRPAGGGWWSAEVTAAGPGSDYAFSLDGAEAVPDPRSAWQPAGVDGPSRAVDHAAFAWTDQAWRGRPLAGAVLYELHVGTFTPEGTFDAAAARLDHLVRLGVDAVEVLPVNAFPGGHGWGYDGVGWYAVQDSYGGPEAFRRFVDAAHGAGLAVVLDVVYNHLGPAGNHLARFGPYFTERHSTPWGPAVNYDDAGADEVRRFVLDNARQWFADYHVDGLRLDAVHAIVDTSATHLLAELAGETEALSAHLGRELTLIAESDLNDARLVRAREAGGYGLHAQWSDDFHHALHAALTGERDGYYVDFGPLADLATALTAGYVYAGRYSAYRQRRHGAPYAGADGRLLPGNRLLGYAQDHDQIGNRARGERLSALVPTGLLRVAAALVLTAPFTPMLFMGEEWGATTPWQYFTDHEDPALAEAVRRGRREEFAAFGWDPEQVPDPQDPATFERSRLDWSELVREPHAGLLRWHAELIRLRREWPELTDGRLDRVAVSFDEEHRWLAVRRGRILVAANLADVPAVVPAPGGSRVLLASGEVGIDERGVHLSAAGCAVVQVRPPDFAEPLP
jgi:maltooligosyltrehalose trehalohydrolase